MKKRIQQLFLSPRTEWDLIRSENASATGLFLRWVLPLALLPFAATLLRFVVWSAIMGSSPSLAMIPFALGPAAGGYVASLISVFVFAWIIHALAPRFGARPGFERALTVAVYASVPGWLFSLLGLIPLLGILSLAGLAWGIWLLRLGLPRLMESPEERSTAYTATVVLIGLVVALVLWLLLTLPFGCMRRMERLSLHPEKTASEKAVLPAEENKGKNGGTARTERMEDKTRKGSGSLKLEDIDPKAHEKMLRELQSDPAMKSYAEQKEKALDEVERMAASRKPREAREFLPLIPSSINGLARSSVTTSKGNLGNVEMAKATAVYTGADKLKLELEITQNSPECVVLAGLQKVHSERSDTNNRGWNRFETRKGCYLHASWDSKRRLGVAKVLIGKNFLVRAQVLNTDDEELALRAIEAVDWAAVAKLASEKNL